MYYLNSLVPSNLAFYKELYYRAHPVFSMVSMGVYNPLQNNTSVVGSHMDLVPVIFPTQNVLADKPLNYLEAKPIQMLVFGAIVDRANNSFYMYAPSVSFVEISPELDVVYMNTCILSVLQDVFNRFSSYLNQFIVQFDSFDNMFGAVQTFMEKAQYPRIDNLYYWQPCMYIPINGLYLKNISNTLTFHGMYEKYYNSYINNNVVDTVNHAFIPLTFLHSTLTLSANVISEIESYLRNITNSTDEYSMFVPRAVFHAIKGAASDTITDTNKPRTSFPDNNSVRIGNVTITPVDISPAVPSPIAQQLSVVQGLSLGATSFVYDEELDEVVMSFVILNPDAVLPYVASAGKMYILNMGGYPLVFNFDRYTPANADVQNQTYIGDNFRFTAYPSTITVMRDVGNTKWTAQVVFPRGAAQFQFVEDSLRVPNAPSNAPNLCAYYNTATFFALTCAASVMWGFYFICASVPFNPEDFVEMANAATVGKLPTKVYPLYTSFALYKKCIKMYCPDSGSSLGNNMYAIKQMLPSYQGVVDEYNNVFLYSMRFSEGKASDTTSSDQKAEDLIKQVATRTDVGRYRTIEIEPELPCNVTVQIMGPNNNAGSMTANMSKVYSAYTNVGFGWQPYYGGLMLITTPQALPALVLTAVNDMTLPKGMKDSIGAYQDSLITHAAVLTDAIKDVTKHLDKPDIRSIRNIAKEDVSSAISIKDTYKWAQKIKMLWHMVRNVRNNDKEVHNVND